MKYLITTGILDHHKFLGTMLSLVATSDLGVIDVADHVETLS